MTDKNTTKEYIIDAKDKKLGRVATEAAMVLRGKNEPNFQPNKLPEIKVIINNASLVDLAQVKLDKEYKRYSGYPGGLAHESREHLIKRKGYQEIFQKAVRGMLPANKLRNPALKNLIINE